MLRNYIKIAIRTLWKQRVYSGINIAGLSIGIACCILIFLWVQHELSYDRFHEHADSVYRIVHKRNLNNTFEEIPMSPLALAPALAQEFPQIKTTVRLLREFTPVIEYQDKQFIEERFFFVDASIVKVFDIEILRGDATSVFDNPNGVVISERVAEKYFGEANPVEKRLVYRKWGRQLAFSVTGVFADLPDNSHFQADFLVPFESQQNLWNTMHGKDWFYAGAWTYLHLPDEESARELEKRLPNFVERTIPESLKEGTTLHLQKLTDIHLGSHLKSEITANGNIVSVYLFAAIASLVLLIACINFMNLATARSTARAKEVGLRKVVGAFRTDLIRQFLGEALILSFLAVALAIGLVEMLLPFFNNLVNKSLSIGYFDNWTVLPALVALGLVVGLIAGSYPALYLSGFAPVRMLKSSWSLGLSGARLRKALVVMQFTVSIVLLIGISIITRQVDYMRNRDLGFNREEILFVSSKPGVNFEGFRNELLQHPDILQVSGGNSVPGSDNAAAITWQLFRPEGMAEDQRMQMASSWIDDAYVKVFNLKLVAGRFFYEEITTDRSESIILNEAAVRSFGWADSPLGKEIEIFNMVGDPAGTRRVIGVVQDYHFESLHNQIKPIVLFTNGSGRYANMILRVDRQRLATTVSFIEHTWKNIAPQYPVELYFLDQDLNSLYAEEKKLSRITRYFTFMAIFVSCLGLFGLAAFAAEKRTKEIGIRKALGASVSNVVLLLSKEFASLVGVAFALAVPFAYLAMDRWLQGFAYRVEMEPLSFLRAGLIALLIALLTVIFQAVKAALRNPVETLRYE